MSLMAKLQKSSKIKTTAVLSESPMFAEKEFVSTLGCRWSTSH